MWFDQMAIPVGRAKPEAAHKFLNFILDAEEHGCGVELCVITPTATKPRKSFWSRT